MRKLVTVLIIVLALSPLLFLTGCNTKYRLCYDGVEKWKIQYKEGVFPWRNVFVIKIEGFCVEKETEYYYNKQRALEELKILQDLEWEKRELNSSKWVCDEH